VNFEKATLQEVDSKPSPTPATVGDPITVQINPATLRLQMSNNVDAGKAFARPNTQYQGSSSSTLSFDLVFDTADEGTTEEPVDVRTRTRQLEKFLLPSTKTPKSVPPRVQFSYGGLTVIGVMSALNQEFDYFALNGVPLRAKCAVTIKEQKPEFDAKLAGPGANTGAGATPPVPPSAGGAPQATPPADRTGTALDGESASDFAGRMGLDPRAWKGLAAGLANPLRLDAGLQIDFSAALSLDIGLGVDVGVTASVGSDRDGGAADDAGAGSGRAGAARAAPTAVPAQAPADGAALTAKGGLSRALDRAAAARAGEAAASTRAGFVAEPAAAPVPALRREPVAAVSALPTPDAAVVTADPRAISYGFGVPLRERLGTSRATSVGLVRERVRGVHTAPDHGVPITDDATVPRWRALRTVDVGAGAGGAGHDGSARSGRSAHAGSAGGCGCGCGHGCGCGGAR